MESRITPSLRPTLAPYLFLHTPNEQALLQYYRQLSQDDQGIVHRVAQALTQYSAMERGENA